MNSIFKQPASAGKSSRIVSFLSVVRRRLAAPQWRFDTSRQSPSINPHAYPDPGAIWNKLQDRYAPDTPVPTVEQLEVAGGRVKEDVQGYEHPVHQWLLKRGVEHEAADSAISEACFALQWEYAMGNRIASPLAYMVAYALNRVQESDRK